LPQGVRIVGAADVAVPLSMQRQQAAARGLAAAHLVANAAAVAMDSISRDCPEEPW
jgi:hypothetical protein